MTERPRDELERDEALRDAYARASAEVPAPALDDAIRAAARRAVHARPEESHRRRLRNGATPWWPLAVAATLAAVTFGITELMPPGRDDPDMRERLRSEPAATTETTPTGAAPAVSPTPPPLSVLPTQPAARDEPAPGVSTGANAPPAARLAIDARNRERRAAKPDESRGRVAAPPAETIASPAMPRHAPEAFPEVPPARGSDAFAAAPPASPGAPDTRRETGVAAPSTLSTLDSAQRNVAARPAAPDVMPSPAPAPRPEARTAPRMAAGASVAKMAPPYAQWLADIEALLARGDEAKARSELAKLLERYPEALPGLPDTLRRLAPVR